MSSPPLRTGSFRSFLQKAWKEKKIKIKDWVGESSALIALVVLIGGGEVHRESWFSLFPVFYPATNAFIFGAQSWCQMDLNT